MRDNETFTAEEIAEEVGTEAQSEQRSFWKLAKASSLTAIIKVKFSQEAAEEYETDAVKGSLSFREPTLTPVPDRAKQAQDIQNRFRRRENFKEAVINVKLYHTGTSMPEARSGKPLFEQTWGADGKPQGLPMAQVERNDNAASELDDD